MLEPLKSNSFWSLPLPSLLVFIPLASDSPFSSFFFPAHC